MLILIKLNAIDKMQVFFSKLIKMIAFYFLRLSRPISFFIKVTKILKYNHLYLVLNILNIFDLTLVLITN